MWRDSLRDLQWRRRRFIVAIAATALVFALTLLLTGLAESFRLEVERTIGAVGADTWMVSEKATGPFTSFALFDEAIADDLRDADGVEAADPLIVAHQAVGTGEVATVFGHVPGGVGTPPLVAGRGARAGGEAVVDSALGLGTGDEFRLGAERFAVVGVTDGLTLNAGSPNVYVPIGDVQVAFLQGFRVANTVAIRGDVAGAPEDFKLLGAAEVEAEVLRPLEKAVQAIGLVRFLLWIVAAGIVASVLYLSALERTRDFAVFKATGTASSRLFAGLALQGSIVAVASAAASAGVAHLLAPMFPFPIGVPVAAYFLLVGVAVVVGVLASLVGARRAVTVDPALAFGGP